MTDITDLLPEQPDDPDASVRHELRLRRAGLPSIASDPLGLKTDLELYEMLDLGPDMPHTLLSEGSAATRSALTHFAPDEPDFGYEADWNPFALGGAWFVGALV